MLVLATRLSWTHPGEEDQLMIYRARARANLATNKHIRTRSP